MTNDRFISIFIISCILLGIQPSVSAQSSDWVYSPYAQYLTNDTTIPPPVGEPADAALSCFRHDTIYVLVMPSGELYIWLRPDPLMDKYIQSSPYAYCDGNPLKYVDPEGEQIGIVGTIINEDGSPSVATFYYGEYEGIRGFYSDGICLNNDFADKATDAIGYIYDGGPMGKMLIDAVVNDDRIIYLCPTKYENQSKCALGKLDWTASDFNLGVLYTPSYIALSHELAHFLSYWYLFADYNTWYMNGMDKITNDEKWAVNVENLIRNENHLEPRMYYTIPSLPGVSGMGVIPQWDWVKDRLEILGHF